MEEAQTSSPEDAGEDQALKRQKLEEYQLKQKRRATMSQQERLFGFAKLIEDDMEISEAISKIHKILDQGESTPGSLASKNFSEDEIKVLVSAMSVCRFRENDVIMKKGEKATFFTIILDGSLRYQLGEKNLGVSAEGELLGELALFTGGQRNVDVLAHSNGCMACLRYVELFQLKSKQPDLAKKVEEYLTEQASQRVLETDHEKGEANGTNEGETKDAVIGELRYGSIIRLDASLANDNSGAPSASATAGSASVKKGEIQMTTAEKMGHNKDIKEQFYIERQKKMEEAKKKAKNEAERKKHKRREMENKLDDMILNKEVSVKAGVISKATASFLGGLLTRDTDRRLGPHGSSNSGWEAIFSHEYFDGFDWQAFDSRRMDPPYKPSNYVNAESQTDITDRISESDDKALSDEYQKTWIEWGYINEPYFKEEISNCLLKEFSSGYVPPEKEKVESCCSIS